MSSTKITQLTPGQEKQLTAVYEQWLEVGRSCAPLNRDEVTQICAEFYSRIGKPAPKVLFFSSPAMCILAWGVLQGTGQLGGQLRGQLGGQLGDQLWGQLRDQLWGQLWDQLRDQLGGQLGGQLGDQLGGQLWGQLGDQLGGQLRDQLGGQLGGQLGDQLGGQLWGQLGDQLRGQLGGQLGGQLRGQLGGQLWGQLGDQLGGQLWGQLGDQLGGQLGDQLGDQLWGQLSNYFGGQHWCAWEVFYSFCGDIGVRYTADQNALLNLWLRQSQNMHWWFPYDGIVLASERHIAVHVDDRGRLHAQEGMACSYSDGWGIYAWHGVNIPAEYYAGAVKPAAILAERNVEVRRALIERYDAMTEKGQFMLDCGAKVLDTAVQPMRPGQPDAVNELLAIDLPDDPDQRMVALRVIDPSTGRSYIIRVPPDQTTVQGALAWSFSLKPEQYRLMQES